MGLDGVELVTDVENIFGIDIPDEVAERATTVGELYDYIVEHADFVVERIETRPPWRCVSASTFLAIRRSVNRLGIETRFGPSSSLEEVFPKQDRRKNWESVSREAGLKFPELVRPNWVGPINLLVSLTVSVGCAIWASPLGAENGALVFFLSSTVVSTATWLLTSPLATEFHSDWSSFRSLTEEVLARNPTRLREIYGPLHCSEAWFVFRKIVVDVLGVDRDEVTREARFVEDLGMG